MYVLRLNKKRVQNEENTGIAPLQAEEGGGRTQEQGGLVFETSGNTEDNKKRIKILKYLNRVLRNIS